MRIISIAPSIKLAQGRFGDAQDEFVNRIVPSVSLPSSVMTKESWTDITTTHPCELKYRIDLEYRSWGVKGASVMLDLSKPILVELDLTTESGSDDNPNVIETHKIITVDPSKIQVALSPGSMISLNSMELHLNPDFTVDYNRSEIQGTTLMGIVE